MKCWLNQYSARICMENLLVYKYGLCSQTISYQKTRAGTFEMPGKLSVTGLLLVAGGAGISLNSLIHRLSTLVYVPPKFYYRFSIFVRQSVSSICMCHIFKIMKKKVW